MEWETLHDDDKYFPEKHALDAGLKNMAKWYWKTDDTSIYFISHGIVSLIFLILIFFSIETLQCLIPHVNCLMSCKVAWGLKSVDMHMKHMRKIVCHFIFHMNYCKINLNIDYKYYSQYQASKEKPHVVLSLKTDNHNLSLHFASHQLIYFEDECSATNA